MRDIQPKILALHLAKTCTALAAKNTAPKLSWISHPPRKRGEHVQTLVLDNSRITWVLIAKDIEDENLWSLRCTDTIGPN